MPLMAIEQIFPASRPSMRSYAIGILGWLPVWVFDYGTGVATQIVVGRLDVTPFLIVRVSEYATSSAVGLIFLNWFVFDFFYYWFHRMQHSIPLLWRIHALHHSIRELNSVMCFHHPIERLLRIIPITLPLALLVRFDEITVIPIASAFVAAWSLFIHMDSRVGLGPGCVFITDNHYRRIHHSEREEHRNKNFAAFFPFWDWVFGTFHRPACGEWPIVGLAERPVGMQMRDFVIGLSATRQKMDLPQQTAHCPPSALIGQSGVIEEGRISASSLVFERSTPHLIGPSVSEYSGEGAIPNGATISNHCDPRGRP
jgi:sterol desaturase/sphingolipid hydroxylase (fatty acid hydroxylase superfamily)